MRVDKLVCDLQLKQIFRSTDRQTLNCRMGTKLTIVPEWQKRPFQQRKIYKSEYSFKSYREIKEYLAQKLGEKNR